MSIQSSVRYKTRSKYFDYLKETAYYVDEYVRKFFDRSCVNSEEIRKMLYAKYRFGKSQLRPAQVRMGYELIGGKDWENSILPACSAVEIKDTGYYCYDDVLDKNQSPLGTVYGGIFIGLSYVVAQGLLQNFDKDTVLRVFEELRKLDIDNVDGSLIDSRMNSKRDEDMYFNKIDKYNFREQALKIGATLGKGTDESIDVIGGIGKKIGQGYIIANDTRDFGKELEDFRMGKYTLPNNYLLEHVTSKYKQDLLSCFGKDILTSEEIKFIRRQVVESGTLEYGKNKAKTLCKEGIDLLKTHFPQSPVREIIEFATTMTQKNKYYSSIQESGI